MNLPPTARKHACWRAALWLCLVGATSGFSQAPDQSGLWSGRWQTHWSDGGGQIKLQQHGAVVTGTYPLYGMRLEATAEGRSLSGKWSAGGSPTDEGGEFIVTLSKDGRTFSGRFGNRGWWTGERVVQTKDMAPISLRSPRDVVLGFIVACNRAQAGIQDAWGLAAEAVEFATGPDPLTSTTRLSRVASLFEIIDPATIHAWDIPDSVAADTYVMHLTFAGSDGVFPLTLHRDAQGDWRIVEPSEPQRVDALKVLPGWVNGKAPAADSYKQLQNPRATMRAFLEGMTHWKEDNGALALSTMDLSVFPDVVRESNGEMSAFYLRHALDNIGMIGLQSIPDDGANRSPYEHFVQGLGSIVIAPTGSAANAPWQFTSLTVKNAPMSFHATTSLPAPEFTPPGSFESAPYFTLRRLAMDYVPFLLGRVGQAEAWQLILGLSALVMVIILARVIAALIVRLLSGLTGADEGVTPQPRWFRLSIAMLLVVSVMMQIPKILAIPSGLRVHLVPLLGSVVCIAAVLVAWRLLSLISAFLSMRAARTEKRTDDILLAFTIALLRLGIVFGGFLGLAKVFSFSATNIIAGLGIGGLAFAFASKETLSNIFGAGILVSDRPFRSGDWIVTDAVQGSVEEVGIRSTRVRTSADSIVVVPNGKLADSTINNLGARRHRLLDLKLVVTEGGTPARLQSFIAAIRVRLEGDPSFVAKETKVGVVGLTAVAVEIQLTAYMDLPSDRAESDTRHSLLTDLMDAAEASGLTLSKAMERSAK